jgi:membrane protein
MAQNIEKQTGGEEGASPGQKTARWLALGIGATLAGFGAWRATHPKPRRPHRGKEQDVPGRAESGPEKENADPARELARSSAGERGRYATHPGAIPLRGWKDILKRTYNEISDDRLLAVAAGVTFYALLAVFPTISAFVSLYGLVADRATLAEHISLLEGIVPAGGVEIIDEQLRHLTAGEGTALGFAFFFSLALALWSANAGAKALFDALNVIYDETEKRSFFRLNLLSLSFTVGALILLVLGLVAVAVVPAAIGLFGLENLSERLLAFLRWPALFLVVSFALSLLYRYGPSRSEARWQWLTPGSLVAAALWIGVSLLFSWYAANFGSYNETYGTLGAAVGFMTWIWLSTAVVLVGAELNAEMEHQTARDSTTGAPRPLGSRGATMADTVGEAKA